MAYVYYHPHYCQCLVIRRGRNNFHRLSVTRDSDSGGVDEPNEKHAANIMKEFTLLRGRVEGAMGVHSKLPE